MNRQEKIAKIADQLVNVAFKIKKGELLVITGDQGESDLELCDAVYNKAREIGAEAMIIRTVPAESHGKVADKVIPFKPFTAMMKHADAWLDTGTMGWLYSDAFETALQQNKKLRYYLISSIAIDQLYDMVVLPEELYELSEKVTQLLSNSTTVRVTCAKGTDITFELTRQYPIQQHLGIADRDGEMATPPATINMNPKIGSMQGKMVTNTMYADPWGIIDDLTVFMENGSIVDAKSDNDSAARFMAWNRKWEDPNVMKTAHVNIGLLPRVQEPIDTGVLNDGISNERVWGCVNWGFGDVSSAHMPPDGQPAKSHSDTCTMKASLWADGEQVLDNGRFVGQFQALADIVLQKSRD